MLHCLAISITVNQYGLQMSVLVMGDVRPPCTGQQEVVIGHRHHINPHFTSKINSNFLKFHLLLKSSIVNVHCLLIV